MSTPTSRLFRRLLLATLLLACLQDGRAQTTHYTRTGQEAAAQSIPEGGIVVRGGVGNGRASHVYDPDEPVDVIVQFEAPPRALAHRAGGKQSYEAAYEQERVALWTAVAAAEAALGSGKQAGAATQLRYDYRHLYNGVALRTRAGLVPHLAALPGVRRVQRDVRVRALGVAGERVTGAERPGAQTGATGQGVVVAIIDSGVDYRHPALGGGIGAGFKVAGGYDFVDDDADPMDENGHGTHVAGIAAASGDVVGVAPGARLLAVRVLDAGGSGEASRILAGIEWAVDPDGDPSTADGAHVINMSLGGPGGPDDALAQAVDNAAAAGILCVVAAGNEDGAYRSVGSPGAARSALTVGATDDADRIAPFSSRGPTNAPYLTKPDLVAPGVDIVSTLPGNTTGALSGTSMAAPYVAGAAALLLERRPGLAPEVLKGLLVQNTIDLNLDVWTQGTGRLDLAAALAGEVAATPSSLSIGQVGAGDGRWTKEETLTLRNLSATARTFDVSVRGLVAPGLSVTVAPAVVAVPAGGDASVTVTVAVDGATLPFVPLVPPAYAGYVVAVPDSGATVRVPVSLLRTPEVAITTDLPADHVYAHHHATGAVSRWDMEGETTRPFMAASGTYTLIGVFTSFTETGRAQYALTVAEDVVVERHTAVSLSQAEARHAVTTQPVDQDGSPVAVDYGTVLLLHTPTGYGLEFPGARPEDVRFNTLSDRFRIDYYLNNVSHARGSDYAFFFSVVGGLDAARTLQNTPADLYRVTTSFDALPDAGSLLVLPWWSEHVGDNLTSSYAFDPDRAAHHRLHAPFTHDSYLARVPADAGRAVYTSLGLYRPDASGNPDVEAGLRYESGYRAVTDRDFRIFREFAFDRPVYQTTERTVGLAAGLPPAFNAVLASDDATGLLFFDPRFTRGIYTGPYGDLVGDTVGVRLSGAGTDRAATAFNRRSFAGLPYFETAPAAYELQTAYAATRVDGVPTEAAARLRFDTTPGRHDVYPPALQDLAIRSGGAAGNVMTPGQPGEIVFTLKDRTGRDLHEASFQPVAEAAVSYRRYGDEAWTPLPHHGTSEGFEGAWPAALPDALYDLRIEAADASGNRLDYTLAPALRHGARSARDNDARPALPVAPLDEATVEAVRPVRFAWEPQDDPDGDAVRYRLRIRGPGLDTLLFAGTAAEATVRLPARLPAGAPYQWWVEAADGFSLAASAPRRLYVDNSSTPVEGGHDLPAAAALYQNYPNPFDGGTHVAYALPAAGPVRIELFDLLGRRVATLVDRVEEAGRHTVYLDGSGLASGLYVCRLLAGARQVTLPVVKR